MREGEERTGEIIGEMEGECRGEERKVRGKSQTGLEEW